MVKSEKEFLAAMRKMIRRVQRGQNPCSCNPSREELEILAECLTNGYLLSMEGEDEPFSRDMTGCPHISLMKDVVPLKGLSFLKPNRSNLKSSIALGVSLFALLVSILSNLDKIAQNVRWLIG